ncbi:MAG: CDP-alcohol phosphatidyltransferase family protein [Desulfuromonas sp.]|nr:MAG: CDP-alcohol phosphatidyltransferase family protein [Desulfuromonas sp.]
MARWTRQIPNTITTIRLLLAVPIFVLILTGHFQAVLWTVLIAGLSDGVDGWLARRLQCTSRYGAIIDPLADKVMLVGAYAGLALVGLLPAWVAWTVVIRDLIIISGALSYFFLFGSYDMEPSAWGKASTFVQITLALLLTAQQVSPFFPLYGLKIGFAMLLVLALVSGSHYVWVWGRRGVRRYREERGSGLKS